MDRLSSKHVHPRILKAIQESQPKVVLDEVALGATVVFETENSTYRVKKIDNDRWELTGGKYEAPVIVGIAGSSFGGGMLRIGCLEVGLNAELWKPNNDRILTSAIKSVKVEH